MAYQTIADYLRTRIDAIGHTPTSFSEALGWGKSYVSNVLNEQFKPSPERAREMADFLGDDPNIILSLAGYYTPADVDAKTVDALYQSIRSLTPESRDSAREFLEFLKWREDHE